VCAGCDEKILSGAWFALGGKKYCKKACYKAGAANDDEVCATHEQHVAATGRGTRLRATKKRKTKKGRGRGRAEKVSLEKAHKSVMNMSDMYGGF
jgi:hypothetical protein